MQNFHLCRHFMPHVTIDVLFSVILLIFCVLCQMGEWNLFRFLVTFFPTSASANLISWSALCAARIKFHYFIYVIFPCKYQHKSFVFLSCDCHASLNILVPKPAYRSKPVEPRHQEMSGYKRIWLLAILFAGFDSFWSDEVILNTPNVSFASNSTN